MFKHFSQIDAPPLDTYVSYPEDVAFNTAQNRGMFYTRYLTLVYVPSTASDFMFYWNPDRAEDTTLFAGTGTDPSLQGVPATTVWLDGLACVAFDYSTNIAYIGMILLKLTL